MAATTTTECVKNNVFLDDSNVVSPSKPLSPTDIEALTEANDNKVVEIPLLSEVVIEISDLNDEINGLKVVGQNIGTIAVVYYLPDSPLVPVTLEVNNLYSHLNQYLKKTLLVQDSAFKRLCFYCSEIRKQKCCLCIFAILTRYDKRSQICLISVLGNVN